MRSIQDVGKEILLNNPAKFYIFIGEEYGVKDKYLDTIQAHYGGRKVESQSVWEVIGTMKKRQLVPTPPKLYVVRYDENFISTIDNKTQEEINGVKINGTIVCLYEGSKYQQKLEKYLPDYTVSIDLVGDDFVQKYLHSDFPGLPDRLISVAIKCSSSYGHARNICRAMKAGDERVLVRMTDEQIFKLFNFSNEGTEAQIRLGVAARNFKWLSDVLDGMEDYDGAIYMTIQTMIDLDKAFFVGYPTAELKPYFKGWTQQDVYAAVSNAYEILKVNRSISTKAKDNTLALFASLCCQPVVKLEVR